MSNSCEPDNPRSKQGGGGASEVKLNNHLKVSTWLKSGGIASEEQEQNPPLELLSLQMPPPLLLSKIEEFLNVSEAEEDEFQSKLIDRTNSVANLKEELKLTQASLEDKCELLHQLSAAVEQEKWEKSHMEADIRSLEQSLGSFFLKIGEMRRELQANPFPETKDDNFVENVGGLGGDNPQQTSVVNTENKKLGLCKKINEWTFDVDTAIEQLWETSEERNREMRRAQERISHLFETIVDKKEEHQLNSSSVDNPVPVESPQPRTSSTLLNTSAGNYEETEGDDIREVPSPPKKVRRFNIRIAASPLAK